MRILHLITARGGSKGIPGKNLRSIGGISLVGWKSIAARRSKNCTRLVMSTDSPEIQEEARRYGAEVLFTRPAELASDGASSADVIAHAMQWFRENSTERFDAVMLLEPSSPFTRPTDYDAAVELLERTDALAVVGMRRTEVNSVFVGEVTDDGRITQIVDQMHHMRSVIRQATKPEWTMNGCLYLFGWEYFEAHRNIYHDRERTYGYLMPSEYSVEIDEMRDLQLCEFLVERGYVDISLWK